MKTNSAKLFSRGNNSIDTGRNNSKTMLTYTKNNPINAGQSRTNRPSKFLNSKASHRPHKSNSGNVNNCGRDFLNSRNNVGKAAPQQQASGRDDRPPAPPIKGGNSKNDGGPVEMPLMRKVAPALGMLASHRQRPEGERVIRDPRFDDISGKLDVVAWSKNYNFIVEMKEKERRQLQHELKDSHDDEEERKRIKLAIQRIDNHSRDAKNVSQGKRKKTEERKVIIEALKQGKKPYIKKNSEIQLEMLAQHFHTLKKENKLGRYLERKGKKKLAKELINTESAYSAANTTRLSKNKNT